MDYLLISRLTKDFLNGSLYGTELSLPSTPQRSVSSAPILSRPRRYPKPSLAPPWVFSKERIKADPEPIRALLVETYEHLEPRPVPGKAHLLRSICKGKGILKQNSQGLVFLEIDERFVSMLSPYLSAMGLSEPPYINCFGTHIRAHIPVISPRESTLQYLEPMNLKNEECSFEIEGLYSVAPTNWPEVEQVWFFKVKSPDLEKIRRSQFLSSVPNGQSFHIAVAIQPRTSIEETPVTMPVMRISPTLSVA
jgi:hypothetical protein